jgi:glucose 1-dehydrogenase
VDVTRVDPAEQPWWRGADAGQRLTGKRAFVTGAGTAPSDDPIGIGEAIAILFAAQGAQVAVADVSAPRAEATLRFVEDVGGTGIVAVGDLSDIDDNARCVREAVDAFGGLDLFVNNAGLQEPYELVDMPLESWEKVLSVNLTGAFLCCREAARLMERGTIVVNTSVHEVMPWMKFSHYAASKGGLKLFVQSIAKELAPRGIRVCSVAPGATRTPIQGTVEPPRDVSRDQIPAERWAEPVEIARAIAWLASAEASYVTGTTIVVDGGWSGQHAPYALKRMMFPDEFR